MSKAKSLAEIIDELKASKINPKNPKIHRVAKGTGVIDRRHFNKRTPGTGAQPRGVALGRRVAKQLMQDFGTEVTMIKVLDQKTGKIVEVEMPRAVAAVRKMYEKGMNDGDTQDLDRFLNRIVGKPEQPIIGGDEEDEPIRIDMGVHRILDKTYGGESE